MRRSKGNEEKEEAAREVQKIQQRKGQRLTNKRLTGWPVARTDVEAGKGVRALAYKKQLIIINVLSTFCFVLSLLL